MRRGGLARLRGPPAATVRHASDVPRQLPTAEKNNARREVQLSPTVRVLLYHWYRDCRRAAEGNPYVFPDRSGAQGSIQYGSLLMGGMFTRQRWRKSVQPS